MLFTPSCGNFYMMQLMAVEIWLAYGLLLLGMGDNSILFYLGLHQSKILLCKKNLLGNRAVTISDYYYMIIVGKIIHNNDISFLAINNTKNTSSGRRRESL